MISTQYVIPILCVVLGWSLSQFSSIVISRREDCRLRSSATSVMLGYYVQALKVQVAIEHLLEISKPLLLKTAEYSEPYFPPEITLRFEELRKQFVDVADKENLFDRLNNAISTLAKTDPVHSYDLYRVHSQFVSFLKLTFIEGDAVPYGYHNELSLMLDVLTNDIRMLRKIIFKVGLKMDISELIRIRKKIVLEEASLNANKVVLEKQLLIHLTQGIG